MKDGLYFYDSIARLRDANLEKYRKSNDDESPGIVTDDIGSYITLGPLGTSMVPSKNNRPRVLLIDEIDKSDIDLPNDLLHIFEEGEFYIPELLRVAKKTKQVDVLPYDWEKGEDYITIEEGKIRCKQFPIVFMTSNGEREFPPAFLRRCLHLDIEPPDNEKKLKNIIKAHLKDIDDEACNKLVTAFLNEKSEEGILATDQLLNEIFMFAKKGIPKIEHDEQDRLKKIILNEIGRK